MDFFILVQAVFDGVTGCFDPVGDLELAEHRLDVLFPGPVTQ